MQKLLLKNCDALLSTDGGFEVVKNIFIGIENDKISFVGTDEPTGYSDIKDMGGKLVMPGLYNCHTHSPMVLLRGIGSDLPLQQWLFDTIFPIEDRLDKSMIRSASTWAIMEMLRGGTVSFSDMYFEPLETAVEVVKTGIKANITRPVQSFDPTEAPADSYRLREAVELYDSINVIGCDRLKMDFSIHAEYTCTPDIAKACIDECNARKANLHIHLSETLKEHEDCKAKYGMTPAEWFDSMGGFNCSAFAAHCVALEDNDLEIFRNRGVSVVHNPTSNMKLGSGFAPITKMLDKGINIALGTDGAASNNNLDMFEEMHLASIIHKGYLCDATAVTTDDVIRMATVNGAKLQGRENCGEIKVGNKADLIALSLAGLHLQPVLDTKALIPYSMQSSDVVMTMVDGKILYENGEFLTIDEEKALFDLNKAVNKLY